MRYVDLPLLLARIPVNVMTALEDKQQAVRDGDEPTKEAVIGSGATTWRTTKNSLEEFSHRKCWYTESKNPGCTNDVDHFRPKAKNESADGVLQYWYWFLAFDPENYRLSCQFSNRLIDNPVLGKTGGKGDRFPLMHGQLHATSKEEIVAENPVLLDPCNRSDCELLVFLPDGRPVISPQYSADPDSRYRVEQSNLILNLDFPTFNQGREELYNEIKYLVDCGDKYGPGIAQNDVKQKLKSMMNEISQYSKAAECYIRCFRDREWVEQMLFG